MLIMSASLCNLKTTRWGAVNKFGSDCMPYLTTHQSSTQSMHQPQLQIFQRRFIWTTQKKIIVLKTKSHLFSSRKTRQHLQIQSNTKNPKRWVRNENCFLCFGYEFGIGFSDDCLQCRFTSKVTSFANNFAFRTQTYEEQNARKQKKTKPASIEPINVSWLIACKKYHKSSHTLHAKNRWFCVTCDVDWRESDDGDVAASALGGARSTRNRPLATWYNARNASPCRYTTYLHLIQFSADREHRCVCCYYWASFE